MRTLKKVKIGVLCIGVFLLAGAFFLVYYSPYSCSKRITNAIDQGNINEFEQIVKCNKRGINTPYYRTIIWRIAEQNNSQPLHHACKAGNLQMVEILLKNGADPNGIDPTAHRTAIFYALQSGSDDRFQIARLLVDNGADITYEDKQKNTPLLASLIITNDDSLENKYEGVELFKYMLEKCGVEEASKQPILEKAVAFDNRLAVDYIVENKIQDVNHISEGGSTPLIVAAQENCEDMCHHLLEIGADKTIKDNEGKTAYDYAVEYGYMKIAEICE